MNTEKNEKKKNTMVQAFKKLNGKYQFLIISAIVIFVGLLAFVLAYGLSSGWLAVAKWFGSKWAIILYIGVGAWILFAIWLYVLERVKKL